MWGVWVLFYDSLRQGGTDNKGPSAWTLLCDNLSSLETDIFFFIWWTHFQSLFLWDVLSYESERYFACIYQLSTSQPTSP